MITEQEMIKLGVRYAIYHRRGCTYRVWRNGTTEKFIFGEFKYMDSSKIKL